MEKVDCRGLPCPQPVMRCRTAVDEGATALDVLVDNEPARENVLRFLAGRGFAAQSQPESQSEGQSGGQTWRITAQALNKAAENAAQNSKHMAAAAEQEVELKSLVLITTETLGRGDDGLGEKLMANFLATLPELGPRLWRVVLLNGGVKLASRPGTALTALQGLAESGVSIFVCGTCLAHYGLLEAKAVGETSNMLDIVTSLDLADKIIRP